MDDRERQRKMMKKEARIGFNHKQQVNPARKSKRERKQN